MAEVPLSQYTKSMPATKWRKRIGVAVAGIVVAQGTVHNQGHLPGLNGAGAELGIAFLVIADPVTEAEVHPKAIAAGDIGSNLADWVKVSDIETSTNTVTLQDAFGTGYIAPYSGAIVDVSAIAAASGKLYCSMWITIIRSRCDV